MTERSRSSGKALELAVTLAFFVVMFAAYYRGGPVRVAAQYLCFGSLVILIALMYSRPSLTEAARRRMLLAAFILVGGAMMLD